LPGRKCGPGVIWRNGEALCVSADLEERMPDPVPRFLSLETLPRRPAWLLLRETVQVEGLGAADLSRTRRISYLQPLHRAVRTTRPTSPELRLAGMIFRLERLGLPVSRVLAFGQRYSSPCGMESFLLREQQSGAAPRDWLARQAQAANPALRRRLLREAGALLHKLHAANFYLRPGGASVDALFAVQEAPEIRLTLGEVERLASRRRESRDCACRDLQRLWRSPSGRSLSRTDRLRFLAAYCGSSNLRRAQRDLWRRISRRRPLQAVAAHLLSLLMTW
jgi:hypothetical protein